jgi:hypothetical protein
MRLNARHDLLRSSGRLPIHLDDHVSGLVGVLGVDIDRIAAGLQLAS